MRAASCQARGVGCQVKSGIRIWGDADQWGTQCGGSIKGPDEPGMRTWGETWDADLQPALPQPGTAAQCCPSSSHGGFLLLLSSKQHHGTETSFLVKKKCITLNINIEHFTLRAQSDREL